MKKLQILMLLAFAALVAGAIILSPTGASSQKTVTPTSSTGIPEDVMKIFSNSCMNCHSDKGAGMAKSVVNFSQWDTYPLKKQTKKASAICDQVTKGSMPPAEYRSSNPDKVPTKDQVTKICNWAATVK